MTSWVLSKPPFKQCQLEAGCCPGFGCDRINFHKKPGGLTQTGQSNRIFNSMWCHAWYLSGRAGWGRVILQLRIELSIGQWANCTLYILFISIIVIIILVLLLFRQTVFIPIREFCLFLLILLSITLVGRSERMTLCLFVASWG